MSRERDYRVLILGIKKNLGYNGNPIAQFLLIKLSLDGGLAAAIIPAPFIPEINKSIDQENQADAINE